MAWSLFKRKKPDPPHITFTATLQHVEEPREMTQARHAATTHGRAKDYSAAVADLELVHGIETANGDAPQWHSEIRRAKYLQKAGRGVEAWEIFENLLAHHRADLWISIDVLDAMRLHLQREDKADRAIAYGVTHRLARVKLYRGMKAEAEEALAGPIESYGSENLEDMIRRNHQSSIESAEQWISELTDAAEITKLATTLCKKSKTPEAAKDLANDVLNLVEHRTDPFDYLERV